MGLRPIRLPGASLLTRRPWPVRDDGPAGGELVQDLSRLLSRAYRTAPTGVDRVEMAWARGLAERVPERLRFAAVHPAGGHHGRLPRDAALRYLDWLAARWAEGGREGPSAAAVRHLWALRPRPVPRPRTRGSRVLLQSSPAYLDNRPLTAARLRLEGARLLVLVHDLIPLTHPEYASPGGAERHRRAMAAVDALADGVLTNSTDTLDAVTSYLSPRPGRVLRAAPLGVDPPAGPPPLMQGRPYFLCLATVEPRKNHLLLLNVWRRMAETLPRDAVPALVLAGRRGWENEQALDMMERCRALDGLVTEPGAVGDRAVAALLRGARALLLPSFTEGFGLPVAEALAAGTPVICSDLPVLREAGGGVPDYLDPLDGPGWITAVLDYAADASPRRAAQLARMADWRAPQWEDHVSVVAETVDALIRVP